MDYYTELDIVLSHSYLDDTFYDADVEYVVDVLFPALAQDEWIKLGTTLGEKDNLYKYKLAYCLEGYDNSNAFMILMILIECDDKNILEQVLLSLNSFNLFKYRKQLFQFPQVIAFLKILSVCKDNKTISRLSTIICDKFKL